MAKAPQQERAIERVARMIDAYAELLDEVGPDHVSTTLIAARSGSAVGSFYQFFRNKEEVGLALANRLGDTIMQLCKQYLAEFEQIGPVSLIDGFASLHHAVERVFRTEPGIKHVTLNAPQIAAELTTVLRPYSKHEDGLLASYVLTAVTTSIACTKAAFANPDGLDILGLSQWMLQQLGTES